MDHIDEGYAQRYVYWVIVPLFVMAIDVYLELIGGGISRISSMHTALPRFIVRLLSSRARLTATCAAACLALLVMSLRTFPLTAEIRYSDTGAKPLLAIALASRATFIVGDYWLTWPVVYEEIASRQIRGEPLPKVFGITPRGDTVSDLVEAAFTEDPQRAMLCFGTSVDECLAHFRQFTSGIFWPVCANPAESGTVDGLGYTVMMLARAAAGQPCPGTIMSPVWDNLVPVARLMPLANRQSDTIVVSKDGPSGLAVYGPYIPVKSGEYRVSWRFSSEEIERESSNTPLFRIDIVDNYGAIVVASRVISQRDLIKVDPHRLTATLDFATTAGLKHCEFRLWRLAPVEIAIDNIGLAPVK
jgi:hypothetical protein